MKTLLVLLSLAVPAALALEFAGINLPTGSDLATAFGLFVVSFVATTVAADYARSGPPRLVAVRANRARAD
jgi:hypothetical protein